MVFNIFSYSKVFLKYFDPMRILIIYSDSESETTSSTTTNTSQSTTTTPSSTKANDSEFCIEIQSSDESCASGTWTGSPIHLFHNDIEKATIPSKFTNFSFCLPINEVDIKNDKFKFHIRRGDGVSKHAD